MHGRIVYAVLLIFIGSTYLSSPSLAQVPGMRKYTLVDGFTANNGYYIDQDKRGYLWIGTDNGGMRFDGKQFVELQQYNRLRNMVILRCAFVDSSVVFLFTFAGLMYSMNSRTLKPIRIHPEILVPNFWGHEGSGEAFLAINQKLKRAYRFYGNKIAEYQLDDFADSLRSFTTLSKRFIGWGPYDYLYAYDPKTCVREKLFRDRSTPFRRLAGERNTHLERGDYIFLYQEKLNKAFVYRYQPGNSVLEEVRSVQLPAGVTDVLFAFLDKNQCLWMVFNNNKGVGYYDFSRPEKKGEIAYNLPAKYVHNVFVDDHNNVWLSTFNNSLHFLSDKHFRNARLVERFPMKTEIPSSIAGTGPELCLSYTNNNVISCVRGGQTHQIRLNNYFRNGCRLLLFNEGRYIAWAARLAVVDTRKGSVSYIGPEEVTYKDACKYDDSSLLFATSAQAAHITIGKPAWRNIFWGRTSAVGLLQNRDILIGTPNGLYRSTGLYDPPSKVKDTVLQRAYILTILALQDSNALIGTDGNGIFLYRSKGSVKKINWPERDVPGQIQKIYWQKERNTYWIATSKGVYAVSFTSNWDVQQFKSYTFYDGLPSNDIRDVYVARDTAYVTTAEGLGVIPFTDSSYWPMPAPLVYINTVQTNKSTFAGMRSLPGLPHDENDFRLSVSAISYESLGNIQYYYRIFPLQKKWTQTSSPDIRVSRLPPGTYTFEVHAVNAKGVRSLYPAQLEIRIHPAFWQTWWFIGLTLAFIIIAVALAVYQRIRSVREQAQLRSDLHVFRDQALRGQMNPHFIYNSLNTIQNYILKSEKMASAFFLSKFSQLMRLTFDNTSQERILLTKDLEALVLYVELENMRFGNKITLHIRQQVDTARIAVPPLILQPFVENAILHGFLSTKNAGNIYLDVTQNEDALQVSITDDGIGREQAWAVKQRRQKYHAGPTPTGKKSGISTTRERIEQAWGKRPGKAGFKIVDLRHEDGSPAGTTVLFNLPLTND